MTYCLSYSLQQKSTNLRAAKIRHTKRRGYEHTVTMTNIGPNISSCMIGESLGGSNIIVGAIYLEPTETPATSWIIFAVSEANLPPQDHAKQTAVIAYCHISEQVTTSEFIYFEDTSLKKQSDQVTRSKSTYSVPSLT